MPTPASSYAPVKSTKMQITVAIVFPILLIAILIGAVALGKAGDASQSNKVTLLSQAGFTNVIVTEDPLGFPSDTVAHVNVTPTCTLTLNWVPPTANSEGNWVYKWSTAANSGVPVTTASTLLKAGACNH